jgi:outer membrane protein insertion porin family/translocation and assembly module TamA
MSMRAFGRSCIVALVALLPALSSRAGAQEIECDEKDLEVGTVKFTGNRTFSSDVLADRVLITPSSLYRRIFKIFGTRRCLPSNGLAPDVANIKQFYENNGFYDTAVDTLVTHRGPTRVDVLFRINEGQPMRLDSLRIVGLDSVADTASILRNLQLQVGGRFGRDLMNADADTIIHRLRNAGYPRAESFTAYHSNRPSHRASVEFQIVTGPLTHFGSIGVSSQDASGGPPKIDSGVVVGLLGLQSGQKYSDRALADGQRNLYNLGTYRHVGIAIDTTFPHGDSIADVNVELREDLLHQFYQDEGWATLDCFRINEQYTDKNFLDRAQRLELTGRLSKIGFGDPTDFPSTRKLCRRHVLEKDTASSVLNYYLGATLRRPTLFGSHWVPSYSAYTERRGEYQAYLRTTYIGGEAAANRDLARGVPFRVAYTMEYGRTIAQPAVLCAVFTLCNPGEQDEAQKTRRLATGSASLQWLRTDDPAEPTTGYNVASELRGSSPALASDSRLSFVKGTIDASWYTTITRGTVFVLRARAGMVSLGNFVPPQERLFAGGANSVRGFPQNELGPIVYLYTRRDTNQFRVDTTVVNGDSSVTAVVNANARAPKADRKSPAGGNSLIVMNAELRIRDPFFPDLFEYVPFIDAGQVWTRQPGSQRLNLSRIAVTPGIGLRVFSAVGAIQGNVGYNGARPRPGPLYFAQPVSSSGQAPLICVTAPGETPVPVGFKNGIYEHPTCPATFIPAQGSGFFSKLTLTLSVGTSF